MLLQYGKVGVSQESFTFIFIFSSIWTSLWPKLTFAFEIFRCKMKQEQLQIQNTGKNLSKWVLEVNNASYE